VNEYVSVAVSFDKGNFEGKALFVLKGEVTLFGKDVHDCGGDVDSRSLDSFADATVESTYDFPFPQSSPGLGGRSKIGPETAKLLSPHALKRNTTACRSAVCTATIRHCLCVRREQGRENARIAGDRRERIPVKSETLVAIDATSPGTRIPTTACQPVVLVVVLQCWRVFEHALVPVEPRSHPRCTETVL
jgi:hypothetical protein